MTCWLARSLCCRPEAADLFFIHPSSDSCFNSKSQMSTLQQDPSSGVPEWTRCHDDPSSSCSYFTVWTKMSDRKPDGPTFRNVSCICEPSGHMCPQPKILHHKMCLEFLPHVICLVSHRRRKTCHKTRIKLCEHVQNSLMLCWNASVRLLQCASYSILSQIWEKGAPAAFAAAASKKINHQNLSSLRD